MPRHRDQSCSRFKEVVKLSIGKLEQQFPIIKGGGGGGERREGNEVPLVYVCML